MCSPCLPLMHGSPASPSKCWDYSPDPASYEVFVTHVLSSSSSIYNKDINQCLLLEMGAWKYLLTSLNLFKNKTEDRTKQMTEHLFLVMQNIEVCSIKKVITRAREGTQQLRLSIALPVSLGLVLRISELGQYTGTCNSSSRGSNTLFWILREPPLTCIYQQRHTYKHTYVHIYAHTYLKTAKINL